MFHIFMLICPALILIDIVFGTLFWPTALAGHEKLLEIIEGRADTDS